MSENFAKELEETIWGKIIENVRDLGQILTRPEDYAKETIKNRLDRASCTSSWVLLLRDRGLLISDLMQDAHDLITYFYDLIKYERYQDGKELINATELNKIVRPDPSIKFPDDLIPVFETILRNYYKTYYLVR